MSAPTHPPTCVCTACNPSARKSAYEQVIEGLEARLLNLGQHTTTAHVAIHELEARLNASLQRIEQLERDVAMLKGLIP